MWVSVKDSQGLLESLEAIQLRKKLFFAMVKFGKQVRTAKAYVAFEETSGLVYCGIDVQLASGRLVSVTTSKNSLNDALSSAIEAVENKVAFRVDWQAWLNIEKLSTWLAIQRKSLGHLLGAEQPKPIRMESRVAA